MAGWNMDRAVGLALLTLALLGPQGLSSGFNEYYNEYNYQEYYYDQEAETDPPVFLAEPRTFTVEVGQTVVIPCDVENNGNNKLIIKKVPFNGGNEKLLAVGEEKVTPDRRVSVERSRLTISHARPRDAGVFICQFDLEPPLQLRHRLDVQFAPSVRSLVPPEQHVAKGKSVTLECKAQGNPEPVIRWSRQEGPLPSGLQSEQGQSLTLAEVDRHVEGTYLCTADNGIGQPASAAMTVTVEYPPEITTEKAIVRTGEGDQVELVCVVHGRPAPDVTWTRDGHPLPENQMDTQLYLPKNGAHYVPPTPHDPREVHLSQIRTAHRHTLTIKHVTEKDFGAYVCIAKNAHGQKDAVIQMTALPNTPHITSSPNGGESDMYTLTWEAESYYPVTEFMIKYRKNHMGGWHENRTVVLRGGDWQSVTHSLESEERNLDNLHTMAFTLKDLEIATDYVAVVRVRNKYGWSAESPNFNFSTKKGKSMAVLQATSGALRQAGLPLAALLLTFAIFRI